MIIMGMTLPHHVYPKRETNMVQQAHKQSVDASVSDIAGFLQSLLSRRVTAYLAGVRDARTVSRWVSGESPEIRAPEVETRLRTSYAISILLSTEYSTQTVKAWFISLNPYLDNVSPVQAIREGKVAETMEAARIFISS